MKVHAQELPEKDFSCSHFYVWEDCAEAGCRKFISVVVSKYL
jgi:hypothetical protein